MQNLKNAVYKGFSNDGKKALSHLFFNASKRNFSKKYDYFSFDAKSYGKERSLDSKEGEQYIKRSNYFDTLSYPYHFQDHYHDSKTTPKIDTSKLSQIVEEKPISNISYFTDHQDPLESYEVSVLPPKCGVEDFYPNGNPPLPNPKEMQNVINEYIQTEAKNGNEEMQNKFVCVMTDKHFDCYHKICNAPAVALNILPFKFRDPTDDEIKEVFNADTKNGNIAFAVADYSTKKVVGCFGIRFRHANMPSKNGGYKDIVVPEVWSKMSDPQKGMLKLLRKFQEQLYKDGFQITYARVGYNNNTDFHEPTKKHLKMIPSFKIPGNVESNVMVQLFYGYKDKTKEEISKDEHYFLNGLALQIANIKPTEIKQEKESNDNDKGFGR